MGRKPIQIAKIDNRVSRNTTFTKRRQGLFGKAAQLCALSDTQLAIIVFSSAGTLFSMGHPSVDALVGNYMDETTPDPVDPNCLHQVADLQAKIEELKRQVKEERELKKQRSKISKEKDPWWGKIKLEEFKVKEELQCLQKSLMKLRENVSKRMNELVKCSTPVGATDCGGEPMPLTIVPAPVCEEPMSRRSKIDIPTSTTTVISSISSEEPLPPRSKIDVPVFYNQANVDGTLAVAQEDPFWYLNEADDEIAAFLRDDTPLPLNAAYFTPPKFC